MRRFPAVVLVAFLAVSLIAAGPSTLLGKPSVIVYPFTATASTINREASSQLATIIATQMAASGRVTVIPPPPGTERKDFLAVARAQNADYYIAGFISPLGTGVSVVEQVVSSTSGIVISSNTTQLTTFADAAGQGEDLAVLVSRHANRALSSIGTPPPASAATPAPTAAAQANLGRLFGRKKKTATATPSPKPTPTPTTAAALVNVTPPTVPAVPSASIVALARTASIAVLPVAGSADTLLRDAATDRIASRAHADRAPTAVAACAEHPHDAILAGSLTLKADPSFGGASASLELVATNCAGKTLWSRSFTSDAGGLQGPQIATDRVVDAAVGAYLNPPKTRPG